MTSGNVKPEVYRGRKVYFLSTGKGKKLSYGRGHCIAFIKMKDGEERVVGHGYTKRIAFNDAKKLLDKYYIKFRM